MPSTGQTTNPIEALAAQWSRWQDDLRAMSAVCACANSTATLARPPVALVATRTSAG